MQIIKKYWLYAIPVILIGLLIDTMWTAYKIRNAASVEVIDISGFEPGVVLSNPVDTLSGELLVLSDFSCAACREFYQDTLRPLIAEHDVRIFYKTVSTHHRNDLLVKLAIDCSPPVEQARIVNAIMLAETSPSKLKEREVLSLMWPTGEIHDEFVRSCMDNPESQKTSSAKIAKARADFNVVATPTIIINGRTFLGHQSEDFIAGKLTEFSSAER